MDKEFQNRLEHFAVLKSKYKVTSFQDLSPSSLLYLILRKFDLGLEVTELEFNWLRCQELFETAEIIFKQQEYKSVELRTLRNEFDSLKSQYQIPKIRTDFKDSSNTLFPILWKLNSEKSLTNSEIEWLKNNQLNATIALVHKMQLEKAFFALKTKYQATKYQGLSPNSPLYKILKKLDDRERLNYPELEWLKKRELFETIKVFEQQEIEKQANFIQLKIKYHANQYPDISISSPLYSILQKLDNHEKLIETEFKWLEKQELTETIAIVRDLEQAQEFAILKLKYKANQYVDSSLKSHLYKVLKIIEGGNYLSDQDINFLKKRKLTETIQIADERYISALKFKINLGELLNDSEIIWLKNHGHEDIINLAQQQHFRVLKRKYGLVDPLLPIEPFYTIMLKLEKGERLDPILVIPLIQEKMLSYDGKIALAHHKLEAEFYEKELQRTGNKWHIPTASSYWRKADEPEKSLKVTDLNLGKIKESKLKSAILVTRGGAFRDMIKLDEAENCARKAIEYHPDSYQPYTLMGAIFYDRGSYAEGDYWFEQAIQRGAKTEDIDDEIKRVLRSTRDEIKRHEAAEYLLRKDAKRYSWAKSHLMTVSR